MGSTSSPHEELTETHILMNKAQAALWLQQAGYELKEVAAVVGLPNLLDQNV